MNTQIKLYKQNNQLQLTVYKVEEQSEKVHLNTSNQKLISKFINAIKSPIIFANFVGEDTFKIQFEDTSIVIIDQYSKLKDYFVIKSLIKRSKKLENKKKTKSTLTRAALISLGVFLGFNHLSKKVVYAKSKTVSKYYNDFPNFEIDIEKEFEKILDSQILSKDKIQMIEKLSIPPLDEIKTETMEVNNDDEKEEKISEELSNNSLESTGIGEKRTDESTELEEIEKIEETKTSSEIGYEIPSEIINEIIEPKTEEALLTPSIESNEEINEVIPNNDIEEEINEIVPNNNIEEEINEVVPTNENIEESLNEDDISMDSIVSNESKTEEEQVELIEENTIDIQEIIEFGQNTDEKLEFVHENYGEIIENYALMSGIDQHLLECIYAQERGVHSEIIDPLGTIGIAQLLYNDHVNKSKTLYNVLTGETETFIATEEIITSLDGNIKTSVALLQYLLNYYDGNTMIALQAYNYGNGAMDKVLENTEARTGISKDEIIHNPSCLVWLEDVKSYKDGKYGDPNYIEKIFSRYNETEFTAIYSLENPVVVNLEQKTLEKSR